MSIAFKKFLNIFMVFAMVFTFNGKVFASDNLPKTDNREIILQGSGSLGSGFYKIEGDLTVSNIKISSGTADIFIPEGKTLTLSESQTVSPGSELYIHGKGTVAMTSFFKCANSGIISLGEDIKAGGLFSGEVNFKKGTPSISAETTFSNANVTIEKDSLLKANAHIMIMNEAKISIENGASLEIAGSGAFISNETTEFINNGNLKNNSQDNKFAIAGEFSNSGSFESSGHILLGNSTVSGSIPGNLSVEGNIVIPAGKEFSLSQNQTLHLNQPLTLTVDGKLNIPDTAAVELPADINSKSKMIINGSVSNNGNITSEGDIDVSDNGSFENNGNVSGSGSVILNSGSLISGNLPVNSSILGNTTVPSQKELNLNGLNLNLGDNSHLTVNGKLNADANTKIFISSKGNITNNGIIESGGEINSEGKITNNGNFINNGNLNNSGKVINSHKNTITNNGTFKNSEQAVTSNEGTMDGSGKIVNSGRIDNLGKITSVQEGDKPHGRMSQQPEEIKNDPTFQIVISDKFSDKSVSGKTAQNIEDELKAKLEEQNIKTSDMLFYDIMLLKKSGGEWNKTEVSSVPGGKLTLSVPYPAGTNKSGFDFFALHMKNDGSIENLLTSKNDSSISVEVTGLSPVSLGWKALPPSPPAPTPSKPSHGGENRPSFAKQNEEFWKDVNKKIEASKKGDVIKIDAGNYINMPFTVMENLRDKKVSMTVKWDEGSFIIPAGRTLKSSVDRIYYPLDELQKFYKNASLEDAVLEEIKSPEVSKPSGSATIVPPAPKPQSKPATPSKPPVVPETKPEKENSKPEESKEEEIKPEDSKIPEDKPADVPDEEEAETMPERNSFPWWIVLIIVAIAAAGAGIYFFIRSRDNDDSYWE